MARRREQGPPRHASVLGPTAFELCEERLGLFGFRRSRRARCCIFSGFSGGTPGRCALLLVATLATLTGSARAAETDDGRTLNVVMNAPSERVGAAVPLAFGRRLTLVMPAKVRMAVPGTTDVLVAHVRDDVVVVSLIDSPYVQGERPETHLSVLSEEGLALTVPFRVAAKGEAVPDLLRVTRGPGIAREATADMLAATEQWLRRSDTDLALGDASGFGGLEPALAVRAERGLARQVARSGVAVLESGEARTKSDFIYLARSPVVRVGERATVQLKLRNHSQPTFRVDRVTVFSGGVALPAEQVITWTLGTEVPPDGEPRNLGVVFPATVMGTEDPTVQVCGLGPPQGEGPCVKLSLN